MQNILSIALIALSLTGCTQKLAERLVDAPNRNLPAALRGDASADRLQQLQVSRQLRVTVNSPVASICVFITEPTTAREEVFMTGKGRRLEARLVRKNTSPATQQTPRATLFLLHGVADDMELGPYTLYREILTHQGYRVVQLDFRGHGRSTGNFITYGFLETQDLMQVLDELERRNLVTGEVGVLGISYGGAVAIQWAAVDPRVKAIVALEPYCTLRDAARDASRFVLRDLPIHFTDAEIDAAVVRAGKIADFDPEKVDGIAAIQKTKAPVLLIHSLADEMISYRQSVRLHQAAPDHSKLILIDGQSHFDMWYWSLDLIRSQTTQWFRKNLNVQREN